MPIDIEQLLNLVFTKNASDLHIHDSSPPVLRIEGELRKVNTDVMTGEDCRNLIYSLLTERQKEVFENEQELDLSFSVEGKGRIRMNVYIQRGSICASLRAIATEFLSFKELRLPAAMDEVARLQSGLILVTGPTGCGKSTTLASVINYLNEHRKSHILTIEDPIEHIHEHKNSIVSQREIGSDSHNFPNALKYALRQDPDIIMIGEMRDKETIASALTIAETGHLVFATLHTSDAPQSINRIIDVFPAHQQDQVRAQLSLSLQAIFCQKLLRKSKHAGGGRILAVEVLNVTPAIRNIIRDEKLEQIHSLMQTGGEYGMQTMNMSLATLYRKGYISFEQALDHSNSVKEMKRMLGKA
ncbi:type IV pilus twitching motility protein PilT [Elusimicrobiota bacterium]